MTKGPSRATFGTNRWDNTAARGRLERSCPTCGAPPYASCVRVRSLKVTGQDLTLPDPSYTVRLKTPHRDR